MGAAASEASPKKTASEADAIFERKSVRVHQNGQVWMHVYPP
jgi:hypothetical protein